MFKKPTYLDFWILSFFAILITFQPHYLHQKINLFELGLYLPGIDAILKGAVPYRDFIHLRGPFEIYLPAAFMSIFGNNIAVLSTYFYIGTILTIITSLLLAQRLLQARFFYYLLGLILISKTFPRVVFTYWGGFRFICGLLVLLCALNYFNAKKLKWILLAGILSGISFLTSIEIGVCSIIAVVVAIVFAKRAKIFDIRDISQSLSHYFFGMFVAIFPLLFYFHMTDALLPYWDATMNVILHMANTFPQDAVVPENIFQALIAIVNPFNKNFRHLTPVYCFLVVACYLVYKFQNKNIKNQDIGIVLLATYFIIFFISAFRNIWSSNFEMLLQPEKILLFVMIERFYFFIKTRNDAILTTLSQPWVIVRVLYKFRKPFIVKIFILGIFMSSVCFSFARFQKRFVAFQIFENKVFGREGVYQRNVNYTNPNLKRVGAMSVPYQQASDFVSFSEFIERNTNETDAILMFPELGSYNFIVNRPFIGRFPICSLTWFNQSWHEEFLSDLNKIRPKYAVLPKNIPEYYYKTHFVVPENKEKYDAVITYINDHYQLVNVTDGLKIFKYVYK